MYLSIFIFFNDTATTEIYTLSLHDALPIWLALKASRFRCDARPGDPTAATKFAMRSVARRHCVLSEEIAELDAHIERDRKSTRLNSSHANISYAVFCLKKKKDR